MTQYNVTIYQSLTGRWCIRHPSGHSHRKHFASLAYAKTFCKRHGWTAKLSVGE